MTQISHNAPATEILLGMHWEPSHPPRSPQRHHPSSLEAGEPHYHRLQGPRLLLEWDNTQDGADHAHSVWRDPENDFGLDLLDDHHRAFAHR